MLQYLRQPSHPEDSHQKRVWEIWKSQLTGQRRQR
jgi:hypothetical protein